ncbi:MAG: hypothetical protein JOY73_02385 [Actinobacteria bacterium]|nr:hypothetical protein [Actinomycetota bacterium]
MVLALKLVLTPAVMVGATLAGRRWGGAVSGWLIGLPLTSGPLVLVLALEHGRHFAARTATGSLSGAVAEAAFCVGWAFGGRAPLLAASLGFAAAAALVHELPLAALVPLAPVALLAGLRLLPPFPERTGAVRTPRWDLPVRVVVAVTAIVTLSALATTIGARLTGLLAVYPLYSAVLASFAQRLEGRAAAVGLLRGLLLGLFSFAAFYSVLAFSLGRVGIGPAFVAAIAAGLIAQGLSLLRILRRPGSRSGRDLPPAAAASASAAAPPR